jgi:hypothetical protein
MQHCLKKTMSWLLCLVPALAPPVRGQQMTTVHPGFTLSSLRPSGFNPMVGGLDFLPDGRMVVCTWEGFGNAKGSVYIVNNAQTGDASKVTYKKFASNLNEPLGVKAVDGRIYVLQKDQLSLLVDSNNDGTVDSVRKIGSGWTVQPGTAGGGKSLEFAMGMVYRDSVFYAGLAINYPYETNQSKERGCIIQISPKTGGFTPYACGMRTPDGLVLGPENELFVTENQGNWVPSSKLLHARQGRFFNVHKPSQSGPGPFDDAPVTPPAIWLDHGAISISPTQPAYLTSGIYQGQMIAGDANFGTLQRYFLEKVGGDYQGCVFRFSAGLEAAAHRIVVGPDGAVYIGGIGTQEWGGWDWAGKNYGLQRMIPNGKKIFDVLAIRSMSATTMEVEFTTPAGQGADAAANYKVQQWAYVPQAAYGAGKQSTENLSVSNVSLSADKLKATLTIPGMKLKDVIYFKLSGITGQDNAAPWSSEAWYTLNAIGPGTPVTAARPVTSHNDSGLRARTAPSGKLGISLASEGPFTLELRDIRGTLLETFTGNGPAELCSREAHPTGLYAMRLKNASGVSARTVYAGGAQ